MLTFSTGNSDIPAVKYHVQTVAHQRTAPLLQAAADATEEAIVNALLAAETMVRRDGITAYGLEPDRLLAATADQPR